MYIVRNFKHLNLVPNCPKRSCSKITGPFDVSLIARAIAARIGESISNKEKLPKTSITRFTTIGSRFFDAF